MPDKDREAHILELKRLVQGGKYKVDPPKVASAIIRKTERRRPKAKAQAAPKSL
jgi:anti-sigma28 factor (negative regulator of flagellin synthesis)